MSNETRLGDFKPLSLVRRSADGNRSPEVCVVVSAKMAEKLHSAGAVRYAVNRDREHWPVDVVYLRNMYGCGYKGDAPFVPCKNSEMTVQESQNFKRICDIVREDPETFVDRFHQDRKKQLHKVNQELENAVISAARSENVPVPATKTKGDQTVENARAGSLKQIDESVGKIEEAGKLLKRIGTDDDVQKAIEDGVKAFAPYRKLRKKGKG